MFMLWVQFADVSTAKSLQDSCPTSLAAFGRCGSSSIGRSWSTTLICWQSTWQATGSRATSCTPQQWTTSSASLRIWKAGELQAEWATRILGRCDPLHQYLDSWSLLSQCLFLQDPACTVWLARLHKYELRRMLASQATSLPRERVKDFQNEAQRYIAGVPQAWDRYGARAAVEGIGSQVRNMSVQQQANG